MNQFLERQRKDCPQTMGEKTNQGIGGGNRKEKWGVE